MKRATLAILACPSCRRGYELVCHAADGDEVISGGLTCPGCGVVIPIVEGFVLFTEPRLRAEQASPTALAALTLDLFGDPAAYETHRRQKDERDYWESYAAFQPFNESSRAAEPLLPAIRAHLKPGDAILDTWARTGWSGEWLAGLFPDHPIISLWEGDSNVLGYRGFRHWLGSGRRSANLDVIFLPPNHPLPFRDGAFGAVYALDSLHRYDLYPFGGECLRVARADGALLFAHLHLTNSEPDPFFERGCHQYHGRDYRGWLDQALKDDPRRGWVFSEADLFAARPGDRLADTPDTPHYNGDVFIGDPRLATMIVEAPPAPAPDTFLLVNPLLRLEPARSTARVDDSMRNASVGHLLDRHPVYRARLPAGPRALSSLDWLILCLSVAGRRRSEIMRLAGAEAALAGLIADEVLLPVQVSRQALSMQRFHANQLPLQADDLAAALFERWREVDEPALILPDGAALSGRDMVQTVSALMAAPALQSASRLAIEATGEPLAFLAALAAIGAGWDLDLVAEDGGAAGGLLIHNRSSPAGGEALSLYDETQSIAEQLALAAGRPAPGARTGGSIGFATGQGRAAVPSALLLEAAASLRHAMRQDLSGVADFGGINTLLLCLAALMRGEAVTFGGTARPAP